MKPRYKLTGRSWIPKSPFKCQHSSMLSVDQYWWVVDGRCYELELYFSPVAEMIRGMCVTIAQPIDLSHYHE